MIQEREKIIEENIRRMAAIRAPYNPISGEGSTSIARTLVEIEDFPLKKMYLPTTMIEDKEIESLIANGAKGYLRKLGGTTEERDILTLWIEFCRCQDPSPPCCRCYRSR